MSENHIEALRPMVLKMGERVGKMKGLPDLSKYRCWHLPGDHVDADGLWRFNGLR